MASIHMVGIGPHDNLNEIYPLDEWDELGEATPANRQWLRIETATEEDFEAWCEARRDLEYYDHRPRTGGKILSHEEESALRAEYARHYDDASARMAALEVK